MKKIKLPLEMANGVLVRTLEELKENWDLEQVLNYYLNGKLEMWLADRYYTDLAEEVSALSVITDNKELQKKLCEIFGVKVENNFVDMGVVEERNRRLDILRQYTADDAILKNVDKVAFNQEELNNLLYKGESTVYLFNNVFSISLLLRNKTYVGVGDVEVTVDTKEYINFSDFNIKLKNIKFNNQKENATLNEESNEESEKYLAKAKEYAANEDYEMAFMCYKIAAANENIEALKSLAELYEKGRGVTADIFRAIEFYTEAANKGDIDAMYRLGEIYSCTKNECWNFYTAIKWYKKAADLGHTDAKRIYNLNKAFWKEPEYNDPKTWDL